MGARFLLAQLHLDSLRDKTSVKSVKKALENLPEGVNGLDLAYNGALQRIESQRDGHRLLAKRLLGWVTYSERPMKVTEVQHAFAIEPDTPNLDEENLSDPREIVGFCAGLVIVDEETQVIRLVHYTTQEYLRRNGDTILPSAQQDIAVSCLTYLLYDQFAVGWNDDPDLNRMSDVHAAGEKRLHRHPFLDYAARYWATHAGVCGQRNIKELMMRFAKDDFRVSTASQMILLLDRSYEILSDVRHGVFDGTMTRNPLSAVHLIAYLGDAHTMSKLLNQGFEVNALDINRRGPLWWAAYHGHDAVVDLLLSQENINVNSRGLLYSIYSSNKYLDQTPLGAAAYWGKTKVVELLIKRADLDVNLPSESGDSPLTSTAREGHSETVGLLLTREDIDVNSRDNQDRTPLIRAAANGREGAVKLLLGRADIDVNTKNIRGETALHRAAMGGYAPVVKLLSAHPDVELNMKDRYGKTALHKAAIYGHAPVVKLLSAHPDVELNLTNNMGQDLFALVLETREWYSRRGETHVHEIQALEECLKIVRAAIEKRSQERPRVMQEEES